MAGRFRVLGYMTVALMLMALVGCGPCGGPVCEEVPVEKPVAAKPAPPPPKPAPVKQVVCPRCARKVVATCRKPSACPVYCFWNCAGDRDCDCIPDAKDKCPMDKENYNGIDDHDGCPEKIVPMPVIQKVIRDSDNDGIVDDDDRCPFEPEDRNGFMDEDGCPDGGQKPLYKDYLNKKR